MRLLLADDHALVREGLKHTLRRLVPAGEFLEAATAAEVIGHLGQDPAVDMAVLDLFMPGCEGFDLLREVCDGHPDLPVVVLSATVDPVAMRKALDIGAAGFITKSETVEVTLSAFRLVLSGGIYVPHEVLRPAAAGSMVPQERGSSDQLTTRQREVLSCLGEGKSNKRIALELNLSENTVKIHVAAILRVLGVDNRTQAAVLAREKGLIAAGVHATGVHPDT